MEKLLSDEKRALRQQNPVRISHSKIEEFTLQAESADIFAFREYLKYPQPGIWCFALEKILADNKP